MTQFAASAVQQILWAIEIFGYAALACGVAWLARRRPMGLVGAALILCTITTNVAYFGTSLWSRVALEVLQALVVFQAARFAYRGGDQLPATIATGLVAIDVAFCATLAMVSITPHAADVLFGWTTNAIFVGLALCVGLPGARDAVVDRRRDRAAERAVRHAHLALDDRKPS